jgi:hypothetical protein
VLEFSGGTLPDLFEYVHRMKLIREILSRGFTRMNAD